MRPGPGRLSAQELLDDALATGHRGTIAAALGTIARACGVDRLAADTGLNRATLYAAFREDGNPTLDTVLRVLAQVKVGPGGEAGGASDAN